VLKAFQLTKPIDEVHLEGCDFFAVYPRSEDAPNPSLSDIFAYHERIRSYVEHEDELVNSRLTWSFTIHGFLFAVYGFLLGKAADQFLTLVKPGPHHPLAEHIIVAVFFLQALVATFGVLVGVKSRNAIVAAHNAIQHLKAIARGSLPARSVDPERVAKIAPVTPLLLPQVVGGGDMKDLTLGARDYYLFLPLLAMWAWVVLCVVSFAIGCATLFFRAVFFKVIGI
jgi:hypothetical protein